MDDFTISPDISDAIEFQEEVILGKLKSVLNCVTETVNSSETVNEIQSAVAESIASWNESKITLQDLIGRYQRALNLWTEYKTNCDVIEKWIDSHLHILPNLPFEQILQNLQLYDDRLSEQFNKISQLQDMVMEIASEIGVNKDEILADEIILLTKKLEDLKTTVTSLNNLADVDKCKMIIDEVSETERFLTSTTENLISMKKENGLQENITHEKELKIELQSLSLSDIAINHMRTEQSEILSQLETSVHRQKVPIVELLESWQNVFRDTFKQYHQIFATIAADQDSLEAVKLWDDYLSSIQEFLQTQIPDNYDNLSNDLQMCQLHENLLSSQYNILSGKKSTNQLGSLIELHNKTLSNIRTRHDLVKRKVELWQRYRDDQKCLLTSLRGLEIEQSRLNLRYMNLKNIEFNIKKIDDMLKRIPEVDQLIDKLQAQHSDLLEGCDQSLRISVKMELDSTVRRIRNFEAASLTWLEFLKKIEVTHKLYVELATNLEKMMDRIDLGLESDIRPWDAGPFPLPEIRKRINILQNYQNEVVTMIEDLNSLSQFEQNLKDSLDPKDLKIIREKNWLLRERHANLKYHIASLILQTEEKLSYWDTFDTKRKEFLSWSSKFKKRLEEFSEKVMHPDIILKRLEGEYCFEVEAKQIKYDWLLNAGSTLSEVGCDDSNDDRFIGIKEKTQEIENVWQELIKCTKGEVEKVKNIITKLKVLKTECKELLTWMKHKCSDLNDITLFQKCDESSLSAKLIELQKIENEVESKSISISNVISRCDTFMMDCSRCSVALDIKQLMLSFESVEERWEDLQKECIETKEHIMNAWKFIQEVLSIYNLEEPWLVEHENKFRSLVEESQSNSVIDLSTLNGKANSLYSTVNNHYTQFKLLEELYAKLLSKNIICDLLDIKLCLERYSALKTELSEFVNALDVTFDQRKEFDICNANIILKLAQLDAKLTQLQHLKEDNSDSKGVLREKMKKLNILSSELESSKEIIKNATTLKTELMKRKLPQVDQNNLENVTDEHALMYKGIKKRIKKLQNHYNEQMKGKKNVNEEVQVELMKFGKDVDTQVDTLQTHTERTDTLLLELQYAVQDAKDNIENLSLLSSSGKIDDMPSVIASCQSTVELTKYLCVAIENQCCVPESDNRLIQAHEIDSSFQKLMDTIKFNQKQEKLQYFNDNSELGRQRCPLCCQRNWTQLENDIWRLETWLDEAEGTLKINPVSLPSDFDHLETFLQDNKEFMMYLESHRDVIVSLNVVSKHLLDHSDNEEQAIELQHRLVNVNMRWEKVCLEAIAWQNKLYGALMKESEFVEIVGKLMTWMDETELKIKSYEPIDLGQERSVIRKKYSKFRKFYQDLKKHEPRVASLHAANQICASVQKNEFENMQRKLNGLHFRLQTLSRLTRMYLLKLGGVLGLDSNDITITLNSSNSSHELLDQDLVEPSEDRPDLSPTDVVNHEENQRTSKFFGRVLRASLPVQALIFLILGVASLFPRTEDEYSCSTANNLAWSLQPILRYPHGPPPT